MTSNRVCCKKIFLLKYVCIMYDFAFVLIPYVKMQTHALHRESDSENWGQIRCKIGSGQLGIWRERRVNPGQI